MEPTLPWYRSPVYVGIVTSIISQLLALIGRADLFPAEQINAFVAGVFQIVAIGALAVSEWKRRTSPVQPLTLTKAGAESKQGGFARVSLLAAIATTAIIAITACTSTKGVVERNSVAAQLIVKVAAMKYIEQASLSDRGARAANVMRVADLIAVTARGEPITLQRLALLAAEQLPENLDPSDRMLAMALISVAQTELQSRIGVGSLESDTLLKLSEVLTWVSDAARLYTSPS